MRSSFFLASDFALFLSSLSISYSFIQSFCVSSILLVSILFHCFLRTSVRCLHFYFRCSCPCSSIKSNHSVVVFSRRIDTQESNHHRIGTHRTKSRAVNEHTQAMSNCCPLNPLNTNLSQLSMLVRCLGPAVVCASQMSNNFVSLS